MSGAEIRAQLTNERLKQLWWALGEIRCREILGFMWNDGEARWKKYLENVFEGIEEWDGTGGRDGAIEKVS